LIEKKNGFFTELPISSIKVNPLFFWKFAITKKIATKEHKIYGDGSPVGASKKDILRMLTTPSYSCVSCDGFKSSLLKTNYKKFQSLGHEKFVVIGHPKAQTIYSLNKINNFFQDVNLNKVKSIANHRK